MPSFDIVSEINLQEVDNAVNQSNKEITTRYDFRGSKSKIEIDKELNKINLIADDDFKMNAIIEIFQKKAIKRGLSLKALKTSSIEDAAGGLRKCTIDMVNGIDQEKAKKIVKTIKETKTKVQAQIQEDKVRVTGKKRDDLQEIMGLIKGQDFEIPLQFDNYRD